MAEQKRKRTCRGAVIGCGFFARNHMLGWAEVDGAEIVAVCDCDPQQDRGFRNRIRRSRPLH